MSGGALGVVVFCLIGAACIFGQEGRKVIDHPVPTYPVIAKHANLTGTVKVQAVIGPDGQVKDVKVIGGHPLFVDATLDALKRWKYAPSNSETTVTLEFKFSP